MTTITTKDGVTIFYKDWGSGQPIVFSHGWPLSSDDWDAQMLFFLNHGYRVIAHDRRGHGRSSQVATGHDMDHYADDLAALTAHLGLKDAIHVGHSTGGGEVAPYITSSVTGRTLWARRYSSWQSLAPTDGRSRANSDRSVGSLPAGLTNMADVESLIMAIIPIWTRSVACSPSTCTPNSFMSARRKSNFRRPRWASQDVSHCIKRLFDRSRVTATRSPVESSPDLRDERGQLNQAILARLPFHVLSVQCLTNGGVTPTGAALHRRST